MFLDVQDMHVRYGSVEAIRGVSFTLMEKEVVTIIGANGAGKSTILKALMGINRLFSGTINTKFGGQIQNLPPHRISRLGFGYIPEGREILGRLTVEDNLTIGGYVLTDRQIFKQRLDYVYDKFPILKERRGQLGGTLSGGEQQMLAIGRALMLLPKILLMDEPSLGLAPLVVSLVFNIIKSFREEGYSILLIEQNAKKALQVSDRGYVLENGVFVAKDRCQNLLTNENIKKAYLGA